MMRFGVYVCASVLLCPLAFSQSPDVRIRGDLTFGLISQSRRDVAFRAFTPLGRFSTVSLQSDLPVGLRVVLSQRVSNFPGDADSEDFDEYYVEDTGSWRVGKQYLPFGGGNLLRESAKAARVDSSLIFEGLPLAVALVEQGKNRQFGVIGRLGSRGLGFSVAIGRHWGINGSAFASVRPIGSGFGAGNGWKQAFGLDWNRRFGKVLARAEGVVLLEPEGGGEKKEFTDLQMTYDLGHRHSAFIGLARELGDPAIWWRFGGTYTAQKGVQIESMVRTKSGQFIDFSVSLRLRF